MKLDDLSNIKDVVKATAKESVSELLEETEKEILNALMTELLQQLQSREDRLIEKLEEQIRSNVSFGVKARDYLYIILVKLADKFFNKLEEKIECAIGRN